MELELRSMYAQINPHFIFNTLNSALLLVSKNRMDEAYMHISQIFTTSYEVILSHQEVN